jgi:phosphoribosyl-AMP cyclohydrolase
MFKRNENRNPGFSVPLRMGLDELAFNADGLVPVIAQQHDTGEVLMLAWMNRAALDETLATGRACYYSRSRGKLWRKGESSGQTQQVRELRVDCDGDTVLLQVDQTGPACHTGRRGCFYWRAEDGRLVLTEPPMVNPGELYSG